MRGDPAPEPVSHPVSFHTPSRSRSNTSASTTPGSGSTAVAHLQSGSLLTALSDSPMVADPVPGRGRHSRSQSWDLRDFSLHEGVVSSVPPSPARMLDMWAGADGSERGPGVLSPVVGTSTFSRQGSVSQMLDATAEARGTCGLIFRSYKATTSSAK